MKNKYIILVTLALNFASCQKNEFSTASSVLEPVKNLKYALNGDTALISWNLTQSDVSPIISEGKNSQILNQNSTQFKFGIVETNKDYVFVVKVTDKNGNISLGEVLRFKRDGAFPVQNLKAEQVNNDVIVKWSAPAQPVNKIIVKIGSQTVELPGTASEYKFANMPVGEYTISVITSNAAGQFSNTLYLPFRVGATAIAYVGIYSDSTSLLNQGDDDEIAGGRWLFRTYSNARYVSFDQIRNGSVNLSQFRVLWWNYDLQTTNNLPAIVSDATVLGRIKTFYENGGSILFNQFAARYFWPLGRMTAPYPMVIGGGNGFSNGDTWGIGVNIGRKHDQSSHPLFSGISMTKHPDGRVTFPVIGPGWREDHNTVIENIPGFLNLGPNDNEAAYIKFITDNNLLWLGKWDGIGDYWMAGIMELKPVANFKGTAIWIGIGGIEWNQNSGRNLYQSTIERMYQNAIDYLKTK